jgi:hypothetical protein
MGDLKKLFIIREAGSQGYSPPAHFMRRELGHDDDSLRDRGYSEDEIQRSALSAADPRAPDRGQVDCPQCRGEDYVRGPSGFMEVCPRCFPDV